MKLFYNFKVPTMKERQTEFSMYKNLSFEMSKKVTKHYRTSLYSATQLFSAPIREGVYGIYGFVRLADEIEDSYVRSFLGSMRADLDKKIYSSRQEMDSYIYGSADVVGLMCFSVFCGDDKKLFEELKAPAMRLGSAF